LGLNAVCRSGKFFELSFTLQSYITQTHMHVAAFSAGPAVDTVKNVPAHNPSPLDRESSNCPFCQAVARAGAFFTPAPPVPLLPAFWVEITAQVAPTAATHRAFAHAWHSRAPPQH
jgi:hypothetical protein